MLLTALMPFTCCSREVLQLFMTEIVVPVQYSEYEYCPLFSLFLGGGVRY